MSQYETSVQIPAFRGMNQTGDGYNMSMQYAREMENVNIKGGSFRPMRTGKLLPQILDHPIGTLAYLHRRYGTDTGTLLVAISDGKVFTKLLDGEDEWVQRYEGLTDSDCDWVTYEVTLYKRYSAEKTYAVGERCTILQDPSDEYSSLIPYRCITAITEPEEWNAEHWEQITSLDPVDILLFSNATDGMFCLYGDNQSVVAVETPERFGVIARYNERIWGSGITTQPDKLMYSAPYDPFDWEAQTEIPEDGAGDILQPTWDGDSFLALRQYGNSLLAIKRNSVWRIYGTNPGEFTMQQQYGGGTIEENTLAVYNDYAYMLGEYGLLQYNGTGAYPFLQDAAQILMKEQVTRALDPDRYPVYDGTRLYFPGDRCTYNGVRYRCKQSTADDDREIASAKCEYHRTNGEVIQMEEAYSSGGIIMGEFSSSTFIEKIGDDIRDQYTFMLGENDAVTFDDEPINKLEYGIYVLYARRVPGDTYIVTPVLSTPFNIDYWDVVDENPLHSACAAMWNGVYCLALPVGGSDRCNAILQYDTADRTLALRTEISVDSFLQINERLFYTSADYPGAVYEMDDDAGETKFTEWVSGYQDLGVKSSIKSAFTLYMMVESEVPVELRLGIRTEKKLKQKTIKTKPGKLTRVHLNTQGRVFRLEIRSYTASPFTIAGGIKLDLELDPD